MQRREFEPVVASIRALRSFVATQACNTGLAAIDIYLIEIAGVEVFTNIVLHAGGLSEDSKVAVVGRAFDQHFELELSYRGDPFVPTVPPDPIAAALAGLPEGGFGLWIINAACDRVRYSQHDGTNTILIGKSLDLFDSLGLEERLQNCPDILEKPFLRGFVGMNAIGLKHVQTIGNALQQERYQG